MAVVEEVRRLVEPILASLGLELFDVTFHQGGPRSLLRVTIDKAGGVTVEDCRRVSRELDPLLDVRDVVPGRYLLEVSSPGADRPLRNAAEMDRHRGRKVRVRLDHALHEKSRWSGRNLGVEQGALLLEQADGTRVRIPLERIREARLEVEI